MPELRMLYILNTTNRFNNFSYSSYLAAKEVGIEYHIAGNWTDYDDLKEKKADEEKYGIKIHQVDFIRNPFDLRNIRAYKQIVDLIKKEQINIIHCNTPIGGLIGRLAGKKCKVDKVIYQAHGFHFYSGAPIFNWLVYYPIEKWLAHYTDSLIVINQEDYQRAKSFKLRKGGIIHYVLGVGIDTTFYHMDKGIRAKKRTELGISDDTVLLISVGDLNKNKNNSVIIEAIKRLPDVHYILCGEGPQKEKLQKLSKPISERVHFLGYRTDVKELLMAADVFVMPSFREGLSRSIMEAMASGLPCVASRIRGNVDLIQDKRNGFLCAPKDTEEFVSALSKLCGERELRESIANNNVLDINPYDVKNVKEAIEKIYAEII